MRPLFSKSVLTDHRYIPERLLHSEAVCRRVKTSGEVVTGAPPLRNDRAAVLDSAVESEPPGFLFNRLAQGDDSFQMILLFLGTK